MGFKKGDSVIVAPLRKKGIILGLSRPGCYEVAVGPLRMQCSDTDLLPIDKKLQSKSHKSAPPKVQVPRVRPVKKTLDLHGLRVREALSLVEEHIDKAILAGLDMIEIVHGKGSGKIMRALHEYLPTLGVVKHFVLDEYNPGTTRVYF